MRIAGIMILAVLSSQQMWAQGAVFADGYELGHTCRWTEQVPPADCSTAEITVTLQGGVPLTLVRIPAGVFWMGSPVDERSRLDQEDLHQVTLTEDYYIGESEITQAQWEAVMGVPPDLSCLGGPHGVGPDYPVYCVTWDEVAGPSGFVERINQQLGTTAFRLPTEAQWERAARAGTQTRFSHGDVLDCEDDCSSCTLHDEYMWWCGNNSPYGSKPVGSKLSSGFGLFDIHGNMYEWVQDWWQEHLGTAPTIDPPGPATGFGKVIRGGGWPNDAMFCRSANRTYTTTDDQDYYMGFRVVRTAP